MGWSQGATMVLGSKKSKDKVLKSLQDNTYAEFVKVDGDYLEFKLQKPRDEISYFDDNKDYYIYVKVLKNFDVYYKILQKHGLIRWKDIQNLTLMDYDKMKVEKIYSRRS